MKEVLLELLQMAQDMILNVLGFVCDMGNRQLLKEFGSAYKKDNTVFRVSHPLDPSKSLFCFPDMVHLFRSLKEVWCKIGSVKLPQDVVIRFGLRSNPVNFDHVKLVSEFQADMDFKFVPKLNTKELEADHFRKTDLPNARCILEDKVGMTLDLLIYCNDAPEEYSTTAWFVRLLNRWFKLVISRTTSLALSHEVPEAYAKAIADLKLVSELMKTMRLDEEWKVVQMATESILAIPEILLSNAGYNFVLLGRFLHDVVENIFPIVRAISPTPTAVEFKYALKRVVLSQFFFHNRKSSYEADDREEAVGLKHLLKLAQEAV